MGPVGQVALLIPNMRSVPVTHPYQMYQFGIHFWPDYKVLLLVFIFNLFVTKSHFTKKKYNNALIGTNTVYFRPTDKSASLNFFVLISQPKHVVGTQKNRLNETFLLRTLLRTQNTCL